MYPCLGRGDEEAQRPKGHDDAEDLTDDAEVGREEPEEDEDTDRHNQDTEAVREEVGTVLYVPIVLSLIVLAFRDLIEGVLPSSLVTLLLASLRKKLISGLFATKGMIPLAS